jgi:hypothetical protein
VATKKSTTPLVLHFQPEKFTVFGTTAKLKQWESLLVKRVGLKSALASALQEAVSENGGTCCESGGTNDCDVD